MKLILVAAAALIDWKGRVLMAERPAGKPMAGLWEFPGGKIESGESPEDALIRELQEELGIGIDPADLSALTFASHAYADFHLVMPLFLCRRWNGTVSAREAQALRWVMPADLAALPMPEADIPLIPTVLGALSRPGA